MRIKVVQFIAITTTALYLVPAGAHLFELPNKLVLTPTEYLTVQKIYAGWSLFGIVIGMALLSTLAHTLLVRADRKSFALSLGAFVALAATQGLFWAFTYPVNAATGFWTVPPEPFEVARWQWEYSHAAGAVLTFAALVAIVLAALVYIPSAETPSVRPAA
jgi:predicted membrane channel-forming protein YqfA (hemolysin III family)